MTRDLLVNLVAALATVGLGAFAARAWATVQRYRRLKRRRPAISIRRGDDSIEIHSDLDPDDLDAAVNSWLNESLGLPPDQGIPVHGPEAELPPAGTAAALDPLTIALQELAKAREEIAELTAKLLVAADTSNKRGQRFALWTAIGANVATMVGLVVTIVVAAN